MPLRIYNTLNRKKEVFEPLEPGKVRMYVCGPTVYDSCHIGHARSVVVFDVIFRYLELLGYEVTYVRNFTDVDDKIIDRAAQLAVTVQELATRYIREFHEDMDALKVRRPSVEPLATEHMDAIQHIIQSLIRQKMAYVADGNVYFAVTRFAEYGKLSGRRLEEMEAGARIEIDPNKKTPFDFALWKAVKPGEPWWESPWGRGRPGWHIECSAMSSVYLGESFDIHGGGKDLIFPHHENEIAQSEGAFHKPFARYWVHNGFVNINQEKMSKSLGNFLLIRDVLRKYHPESIRLFLLSNHYRSPIDFSEQAMAEAEQGLEKIYTALARSDSLAGDRPPSPPTGGGAGTSFRKDFIVAMDDDFNTARAIGVIFEAVRHLNRLLDDTPGQAGEALEIRQQLLALGGVLGILEEAPAAYFERKRQKTLQEEAIDPAYVEAKIKARADARKARDWALADLIRDELAARNIVLEDRPDGTIWKVAK